MNSEEKIGYLTHQLQSLVRQGEAAQANAAEAFGKALSDCTYQLEWLESPAQKLYAGSMAQAVLASLEGEDTLTGLEGVAQSWYDKLTDSLLKGYDTRPSSSSMFHNASMIAKQEAMRQVHQALSWIAR